MAYVRVKICLHPVTQVSNSITKGHLIAFTAGVVTTAIIFTGILKKWPSILTCLLFNVALNMSLFPFLFSIVVIITGLFIWFVYKKRRLHVGMSYTCICTGQITNENIIHSMSIVIHF